MLKGAALLAGHYRHHLGRRPVSDIDLLVRRGELSRVRETLSRLGLRPLARWRGDGIEIDLHTDLARSELIGHRRTAYGFAPARIWESSLPCPVGGPAMLVLPPELQILHLAVHGVKHAFGRWIWLVDLAQLLASAQPDALLAAAAEVRAERALACSTLLLSRELGVETPFSKAPGLLDPGAPGAKPRLPELTRLETEWLGLIAGRTPMGLGRAMAGFSIPGTVDRLAYWGEIVLPSAHTLRRSLADTPGPRARRHRLRKAASRVGQALRSVVRSTGFAAALCRATYARRR